ncbi:hypothetical protein EXS72_02160 [Candidatus Pacearchaeota archaeon]|nr:hypothetical protein [Candidatus Pacearchaeota archaeon]
MNNFDNQQELFFDFIKNINSNEQIGIITHAKCNDGMISAILLNGILKNKIPSLLKPKLFFRNYGETIFEGLTKILKSENIKKVFVLDLGITRETVSQFKQFCDDFEVFYIDHHPSDESLLFVKNIIKTESADCTALTIYRLGENILNEKNYCELVCAAAVSEFSYQKIDNLKFLQKYYPSLNVENIKLSRPFEMADALGSVNLYYRDNPPKAYELVSNLQFLEIEKIHNLVSAEIEKHLENFKDTESYFENQKIDEPQLFFYECNSIFSINSKLSTILSTKFTNSIIIILSNSDSDSSLKTVSARSQIEPLPFSMSDLLKAGIAGLEKSVAGGHVRASGGSFLRKDLEIFKEQIKEFVRLRIK